MAKAFSLQSLLDLANRQSDSAAATLGKLGAEHARMEATLRLLLQYRDEYRERFRVAGAHAMDSMAWRNFHEFMLKLDKAIDEQRIAVARATRDILDGRGAWRSSQIKVKAYDTLAQRFHTQSAHKEARRESRDADELAGLRTRRRAYH